MIQPVNLLMSHFNIENSAQVTRGVVTAAHDVVQGQETVRDSIIRTQTVQAGEASAEMQKVHRRSEDEGREERRRGARDSFQQSSHDDGNTDEQQAAAAPLISAAETPKQQPQAAKKFEFYA